MEREHIVLAVQSTGDSSRKPPAYTPAEPTAKGEIKTTKNGVKYETLKAGTGEELKPGMVAKLNYEGKLENGTVFDSTGKSPRPMTIGTGQLIKGWEEGLPGMRVGETRKLIIPPAMGYGAKQIAELEATINATPVDLVLIATPIDLRGIIKIKHPTMRVRYELEERGHPTIAEILRGRFH